MSKLNVTAVQAARDLADIEAAVAEQFPKLMNVNPEVFAALCRTAAQLYAARLVADAVREVPYMREG